MLKLHKRFPLGNTGLALRVAYDCPLEELDHALEPPARLLVRSAVCLLKSWLLTSLVLEFASCTCSPALAHQYLVLLAIYALFVMLRRYSIIHVV